MADPAEHGRTRNHDRGDVNVERRRTRANH